MNVEITPNYSFIFDFENEFIHQDSRHWMLKNWTWVFYLSGAYMLVIFGGQQFMANRPRWVTYPAAASLFYGKCDCGSDAPPNYNAPPRQTMCVNVSLRLLPCGWGRIPQRETWWKPRVDVEEVSDVVWSSTAVTLWARTDRPPLQFTRGS